MAHKNILIWLAMLIVSLVCVVGASAAKPGYSCSVAATCAFTT